MKKRSKETIRALGWALAQTARVTEGGRLCWCHAATHGPIAREHTPRCVANLEQLDTAAKRLGGTIERGTFEVFEPQPEQQQLDGLSPALTRVSFEGYDGRPVDPTMSPEALGLVAAVEVAARLMVDAHAWQARIHHAGHSFVLTRELVTRESMRDAS